MSLHSCRKLKETNWSAKEVQEKEYKEYNIQLKHNSVQVWSSERLTFPEKSDKFGKMRADIRTAVKGLRCPLNQLFHAVYISQSELESKGGKCDVENILFCNVGDVGCACFKELCSCGIRFERCFSAPPLTPNMPIKPRHYQSYGFATKETSFRYWGKGKILAQFSTKIPLDLFAHVLRKEYENMSKYIWFWMKHAQTNINPVFRSKNSIAPFGIDITFRSPRGTVSNLSNFIKPLIDGTVTSFQMHNGSKQEVADRLGHYLELLKLRPQEILLLLKDENRGILGTTNLFWLSSKGRLRLCPQDDYCVVAEVLREDWNESSIELSGEVFEARGISQQGVLEQTS